jgi:hypothetical protein
LASSRLQTGVSNNTNQTIQIPLQRSAHAPTKGGSSFGSNIIVTGGADSAGNNTGNFSFVLNPTSAGNLSNNNYRSELTAGQSLSWPTAAPSQIHSSGGNNLVTSTDGSTTLAITRKASGLAASGGTLGLQGAPVPWSTSVQDVVVALMQTDGNFVAFDAAGNQVWTSATSGHPGAFLRVSPSKVSGVGSCRMADHCSSFGQGAARSKTNSTVIALDINQGPAMHRPRQPSNSELLQLPSFSPLLLIHR